MALLEITNISPKGEPVHLGDLYTSIPHGQTFRVERSAADLPRMPSLQEALARGDVTLSVTYSAQEVQSGIHAPPAVVEAVDVAPVPEDSPAAVPVTLYKRLLPGDGGADDVEIYPVGCMPFKLRVLDCTVCVENPAGKVELRDEPGGRGNLLALVDTFGKGRARYEGSTSVADSIPSKGLFAHRSDSSLTGELVLLGRSEL